MSTDADLVNSALRGDSLSFGKLAERYRDAAFGIALSKLGDFEAARDAAQDALVIAYADLPTLRDPAKFGSWLCRIARTSAANVMRRSKAVASLDDPACPEPTDAAHDPERSARAEEVREALSTLPEYDRVTLILHYVNGYSHAEIGAILDTSVSAVKSRIHRAKGRLRKEMQEVVEQTLKESVLEQLHLPELRFRADCTRYDRTYAEFLEIKVTEVYGSSTVPKAGDNYLICGEYALKEHPAVTAFAAAANSKSTGQQAFLKPGCGRFAANLHVTEVKEPRLAILSLMIDDDSNAIDIHLEQESSSTI